MKRTLTEQQKKTLSVLAIVIFVLLSAALAWFVGRPMVRFARQPEQFRAWVDGHGAWGPLAYAMMGGILVATVLTILVLPAAYALFFGKEKSNVTAEPTTAH